VLDGLRTPDPRHPENESLDQLGQRRVRVHAVMTDVYSGQHDLRVMVRETFCLVHQRADASRPGRPAREGRRAERAVLVASILDAQQRLNVEGIRSRVVSMPSHELFARQDETYRNSVLPRGVKRIAMEAAHPMSWYRWVGDDGVILGIERFGASAPAARIFTELGLTVDRIVETAKKLVAKK